MNLGGGEEIRGFILLNNRLERMDTIKYTQVYIQHLTEPSTLKYAIESSQFGQIKKKMVLEHYATKKLAQRSKEMFI